MTRAGRPSSQQAVMAVVEAQSDASAGRRQPDRWALITASSRGTRLRPGQPDAVVLDYLSERTDRPPPPGGQRDRRVVWGTGQLLGARGSGRFAA